MEAPSFVFSVSFTSHKAREETLLLMYQYIGSQFGTSKGVEATHPNGGSAVWRMKFGEKG